jgi:hypothetical protein
MNKSTSKAAAANCDEQACRDAPDSTSSSFTYTDVEWREGKRRAVALLRELQSLPTDELDCQSKYRDGRPQQNVVGSHLIGLMLTQNPGVLAAFGAVMTHFIGHAIHGGAPYLNRVIQEMRKPITTTWPHDSGKNALLPTHPFPDARRYPSEVRS